MERVYTRDSANASKCYSARPTRTATSNSSSSAPAVSPVVPPSRLIISWRKPIKHSSEKQREHRRTPDQRREDQRCAIVLLDQRHQGGELEQQYQAEGDHGDRPAARVLHDGQGAFAIAKPTEPGVGAVRQPVQVQAAAEHYPGRQQQRRVQQ